MLVAICVALGGAPAIAQVAAPDPWTPKLNTDPRNPPRFQQFTRPTLAQLGAPAPFTPPASGRATLVSTRPTPARTRAKRR